VCVCVVFDVLIKVFLHNCVVVMGNFLRVSTFTHLGKRNGVSVSHFASHYATMANVFDACMELSKYRIRKLQGNLHDNQNKLL
jgi:hypothetical protein